MMMAPAPAEAQNIFQMLFGGGIKERRERDVRTQAPKPKQPKTRVKRVKISAPSYYTYRPDKLVKVSFAELLKAPRPASLEPSLDSGLFGEALGGLEDFDLRDYQDVAAALTAYYGDKRAFIWVSGFSANGRAAEAVRVLGEAADFALEPADYTVTMPAPGFSMDQMAARNTELIRFEMALSARVLRYVRDAWSGRVDPNLLSGYHDFPKKPLELVKVLDRLAHTQDVRAYLESRHPQNEHFSALRVELEALRASAENDIVVDPKLLLRPGKSSPEFPKMLALFARETDEAFRTEHAALLESFKDSELYDEQLVSLVKAAQEFKGLKGDGVIGPRTVGAFAGESRAARIAKVEYALERLRWHPSDLGSPRVFINQPAFTATYVEGGSDKLSMRVVVGKKSNQTNFFYDQIEQIDYNPYWGVPQSIIVNEMLPKLHRDPGYLDRAGYEVTDARGRRISSSAVNWGRYGGKVPFNVRQRPGSGNALGELKILFPNKHAIYMHDTPSKSLFERDTRAYSHGCVRLADPRGMAAAVLDKPLDYVAAKIGAGHSSEKITRKIPVYVAYFTAWPDQDGKVAYHADVYDRDSRVQKALEAIEAVRQPAG
nr:L,D-transpeptidase family protein [Nitratireductor arenosus]